MHLCVIPLELLQNVKLLRKPAKNFTIINDLLAKDLQHLTIIITYTIILLLSRYLTVKH